MVDAPSVSHYWWTLHCLEVDIGCGMVVSHLAATHALFRFLYTTTICWTTSRITRITTSTTSFYWNSTSMTRSCGIWRFGISDGLARQRKRNALVLWGGGAGRGVGAAWQGHNLASTSNIWQNLPDHLESDKSCESKIQFFLGAAGWLRYNVSLLARLPLFNTCSLRFPDHSAIAFINQHLLSV